MKLQTDLKIEFYSREKSFPKDFGKLGSLSKTQTSIIGKFKNFQQDLKSFETEVEKDESSLQNIN